MQAAAPCDNAQDARLMARKIRGKRTGATPGELPLRRLETCRKALAPSPCACRSTADTRGTRPSWTAPL